jgi:type I restriction enzyme S subunit
MITSDGALKTLPEGWSLASFLEVIDYEGGSQPPRKEFIYNEKHGYVRLLQIRDFGAKPVPTFVPDSRKLKKATADDLLLARYGSDSADDSLGRICFGLGGAYNVALVKLIFSRVHLNKDFVRLFLSGPWFRSAISVNSRSCQMGFNRDDLRWLTFPLPPLAEQERIATHAATLLSCVATAQGRLANVPTLLKRFRQAVLAAACSGRLTEGWREKNPPAQTGEQLFRSILGKSPITIPPDSVALNDLPDSWALATLDQVSSLVTDGDHNPPKRAATGIPHLTAKNIKKWGINFDDCTFITQRDFETTRSRYEPKEDDVIVTCVGTIGQTAIVPKGCVFSADRNLAAIRLKPNALLPTVAQYLLNAPPWFNVVREGSSSTAQPHLYLKTLRALIVPLIPLVEQSEIARRVQALFDLADRIERHASAAALRANKLTQSILAKAFRGELVPTEAELARREGREYEPASVLLERISAERESARRVESKENRPKILSRTRRRGAASA